MLPVSSPTSISDWPISSASRVAGSPFSRWTCSVTVSRYHAAALELDATLDRGASLTWASRGEAAERVAALKVVSTDVALDVTSKIFEVTGARSTANQYGFDCFWRNVRTHTLHDPVAYKRREVGLHYLTGATPDFTLYT
jgi:alkylation response protein AidB-like acyl-CoA dehydrogenase